MTKLTAEIARQLLRYDPEAGQLFWLARPLSLCPNVHYMNSWNAQFSGKEALTGITKGYRSGNVLSRTYKAHRIAWLLQTGSWPAGHIDHINGLRSDNRWANLRDVSVLQNRRNAGMNSRNTSGVNGVSWNKAARKWEANIKINNRSKRLGCFDTVEEAAAARRAADLRYGFTDRHGSKIGNKAA